MSSPSAPRGWLRPRYARAVLVAGLLASLVPLSRRAAKAQSIRFELPARFREAPSRLSVSWTREDDTEALGGFTLTLPAGTPASLLRDISAPNGIYRVDISLERVNEVGDPGRAAEATELEITRQLSLDGTQVRVILEDTPREPARLH